VELSIFAEVHRSAASLASPCTDICMSCISANTVEASADAAAMINLCAIVLSTIACKCNG
jgi:hypothetical protein